MVRDGDSSSDLDDRPQADQGAAHLRRLEVWQARPPAPSALQPAKQVCAFIPAARGQRHSNKVITALDTIEVINLRPQPKYVLCSS